MDVNLEANEYHRYDEFLDFGDCIALNSVPYQKKKKKKRPMQCLGLH
jgi:hypothetical protein